MRLIDTTPFDIKLMDVPSGSEDYKQGYIDGARHVLEEMDEAPTVDAVPLDKLCECLAERYEPPYALVDIDKLKMSIDFRQQKEIWMNALTKWMEEQNA